jgi:hypothetical protein
MGSLRVACNKDKDRFEIILNAASLVIPSPGCNWLTKKTPYGRSLNPVLGEVDIL